MASFLRQIARSLPTTLALAAGLSLAASAATPAPYAQKPPGGKYKDCHGYVLESAQDVFRVHCIDGNPVDISFDYFPDSAERADKTMLDRKDLKPQTPVHVKYTQSWGKHRAYEVFVADPDATGTYGFKD